MQIGVKLVSCSAQLNCPGDRGVETDAGAGRTPVTEHVEDREIAVADQHGVAFCSFFDAEIGSRLVKVLRRSISRDGQLAHAGGENQSPMSPLAKRRRGALRFTYSLPFSHA